MPSPLRGSLLSDSEKSEIIERFRSGETLAAIASRFNVTAGTIVHTAKRAGVSRDGNLNRVSKLPSIDDQVRFMYAEDQNVAKIARALGTTNSRVTSRLTKLGLFVPKFSVVNLTDDEKSEMATEYASGVTAAELSRKYQKCAVTIAKFLDEEGVERRTMSQVKTRIAYDKEAFATITEDSAYWVGFLMADGCVTQTRSQKRIVLSLGIKDSEHVSKFKIFLKTDATIGLIIPKNGHTIVSSDGRRSYPKSGHAQGISVLSDTLADQLAVFGVVPRKTFIAKVIGLESNRDFWRGAVDGDGYILKDKKYPAVGLVGSKDLVQQFADFARQYCPDSRSKPNKMGSIYNVSFNGRYGQKMIEVLYGGCKTSLDRKNTLAQHWIENPFVPEDKIANLRWHHEKYPPEFRAKVVARYLAGEQSKVIAKDLGISRMTVPCWVRDAGHEPRPSRSRQK